MVSMAVSAQVSNLHSLLLGITTEKLRRLEYERIPWVPALRGLPPHLIPGVICEAVGTVPREDCCLQRIARLRCWLLRWHRDTFWRLHQLRAAPDNDECAAILTRMADSLRLRKRDATLAWTTYDDAITACLLTEERAHVPLEHSVVYVLMRPSCPLLGVHYLGVGMKEPVLVALRAALGYDALELSSVQEESILEVLLSADRVLWQSLELQGKAQCLEGTPHSTTDSQAGSSADAAASVPVG
ncbi:hypothetical protein V5799_033717 [Amblyomma americanum]|uniref:Uncharacterized protein n=1 Tax=Amblyomma americanum TaxID=6943 RepID=A0AAQ4DMI4_AMBAM